MTNHCQDCDAQWDYDLHSQRCPDGDGLNFHCYPQPRFKPQQWVRSKPLGPLYPSKNEQIAPVRRNGQGGWLYGRQDFEARTARLCQLP